MELSGLPDLKYKNLSDEVYANLLHPLLAGYRISERITILTHREHWSDRERRQVSIEEAVTRWENGACEAWRRAKGRLDFKRQFAEIERHKYFESQRAGHDVGFQWAATQWVAIYASTWRDWWETLPEANPYFPRCIA